ncbi:MAG: DUF6468 domain-containing protein [Afipia sp.]|nr:DUF6468 domain-containing protein [Afipia sp.]
MTLFMGLPLGVLLEAIVCLFLVATIAYCAMLDRRLRAMRSGQDGLRDLVRDLNAATTQAASAIGNLKKASAATGEDLGEGIRRARALADELALMIEAGDRIADRLGRSDRPPIVRPAAQAAAGPRQAPANAARDSSNPARAAHPLLDALKRAR